MPKPIFIIETLPDVTQYAEDPQLLGVIMTDVRRALKQASQFKNFKKGQLILRFDNFGTYRGLKIGVED